MANRPGYFEEYYKLNKDSVNAERRRKYHKDPSYRERVLKASCKYRESQRDNEGRIRLPRYQTPLEAEAGDGGALQLFSVGAFAVYLGRSVQAITHWERAGLLPPTPYKDERGFRYYTQGQMEVVRSAVGSRRRLFPASENMCADILKRWKGLGVPVNAKSMASALSRTITRRHEGD